MEEPAHECKKCSLPIKEGNAYELSGERWHVECFQCSKCDKLLGVNSNFLVLGTGSLVCSECSYSCKSCGKKIYDMAILTGDQAYCANCFKCKSCKKPIEDLRYARTSKGLFCMPCHHKLMEKKKRYEAQKKQKLKTIKAAQKDSDAESSDQPSSSTSEERKNRDFLDPGEQINQVATEKVQLSSPGKMTRSPVVTRKSSFLAAEERPVTPDIASEPISVPALESTPRHSNTLPDDEELLSIPLRSPNRITLSPLGPSLSAFSSPLNTHEQLSQPSLLAEDNNSSLTPTKRYKSPAEVHGAGSSRNRNAFIFDNTEPDSFFDLSDDDENDATAEKPTETHASKQSNRELEFGSVFSSPLKNSSEKLPSTAVSRTPERSPAASKGLNITGIVLNDGSSNSILGKSENDDAEFKQSPEVYKFGDGSESKQPATPSLDPSKDKENTTSGLHSRKSSGGIGRSMSLKKVFHRHKRSTGSAGNLLNDRDTIPSMRDVISPRLEQEEGFKTSTTSSPQHNSVGTHRKTPSDHSASAYKTPPLPPSNSFHARSRSETIPEDASLPSVQTTQFEQQLRFLKGEITTLTGNKAALMKEIQALSTQKKTLELEITEKNNKLKELDATIALRQTNQAATGSTDSFFKHTTTSATLSSTPSDDAVFSSETTVAPSSSQGKSQSSVQQPGNPFNSKKMSSVDDLLHTPNSSSQTQTVSDRPRKGTFFRRIFGANGHPTGGSMPVPGQQPGSTGMATSPSFQSIGSPKNFRPGEDPAQTQEIAQPQQPFAGEEESKSGLGFSSIIKSRSSNFLRSNLTTNKGLYQSSLQERCEIEMRRTPLVFTSCLVEVEARGMTEGIYRVSGSSLAIDKIEKFFESLDVTNEKEVAKVSGILEGDINAVSGMLKRYLKKLPEPVIPFRNYERYVEISKIVEEREKLAQLKELLSELPPANLTVLYQLAVHLGVVVKNGGVTKMTSSSLATVFAPTLVRDDSFNPQREILDNSLKTVTTELLFRNYEELFSDIAITSE